MKWRAVCIIDRGINDTDSLLLFIMNMMKLISKFDLFESNFALYHIDRVVRETGKVVDNGLQEIYVNAMIKDDSEVSELMKIFVDDDVYNSKFPKTSEAVSYTHLRVHET